MPHSSLKAPCRALVLLPLTALLATPALAQIESASRSSNDIDRTVRVTFNPPGEGEPDDAAGGATRDPNRCPQDRTDIAPYLSAIAPDRGEARTVAARPVFFAYIPETAASQGFFSLRSPDSDYHYQAFVDLSPEAGTIAIQLPDTAPELEVGQTYNWILALACEGDRLRPDSPSVGGSVTRITPPADLVFEDETLSLERAAAYAEAGIWYDAVAVMAELMRSSATHAIVRDNWQGLLVDGGLDRAISNDPVF